MDELQNENEILTEKVKQLDEDTEAGVQMLRLSHARENKLKNNLADVEKKVETMEQVTKENDDLKKKFEFVKEKLEKSMKENYELKGVHGKELKDLENKFLATSNHVKKFENKSIRTEESILNELEAENKSIRLKCDDLTDEIELKNIQIKTLESKFEATKTLQDSTNSLSEELEMVQPFKCAVCSKEFASSNHLEEHKEKHEENSDEKMLLLAKIKKMEKELLEQKIKISTSTLKLKEKERKNSQRCKCKGFCRINHNKFNYIKKESDDLILKFTKLCQDECLPLIVGTMKIEFPCTLCEYKFSTQEEFKVHIRSQHREEKIDSGEVSELSLKGGM